MRSDFKPGQIDEMVCSLKEVDAEGETAEP